VRSANRLPADQFPFANGASTNRNTSERAIQRGDCRRVLVISGPLARFESWCEGTDRGSGWPAAFATVEGFLAAGSAVHWLVFMETEPFAPAGLRPGLEVSIIRTPASRWLLGLIRRGILRGACVSLLLCLRILAGMRLAGRILSKKRFDLIYGIGTDAVIISSMVSRCHGVPAVSRIFGDPEFRAYLDGPLGLLGGALYDPTVLLALRAPAALQVITDDGTRLNEVRRRVAPGLDTPYVYWRNGVDKDVPKVDRESFWRRWNVDPSTKIVLFAGRLVRVKKVDAVIKAVSCVRRELPHVRLVVVGDGHDRARLEKLANRVAGKTCLFVGYHSRERVMEFVAASDICIAGLDGWGNTTWEALAAGKCVISASKPGQPAFLHHGHNIFLVSGDDLERTLATAIASLIRNEQKRRQIGEAARATAVEHLDSWCERVNKELVLIKECILSQA